MTMPNYENQAQPIVHFNHETIDLRGADLEFFGRHFVATSGQLWAWNERTGEARGLVTAQSSGLPSNVSSEVRLRLHGRTYTLSTILVRDGDNTGEMVIRFFAQCNPQVFATPQA